VTQKLKVNPYHFFILKRSFDLIFSILGILVLFPLTVGIAIGTNLISNGPVIFKHKRVGKNGKEFTLIKFRTMRMGAEKEQKTLRYLNEVDGPVFKIRDDPRFVGIGSFLAKTGLDELPQLINVIRGEMSMVGPRPLPVSEAKKLTKAQKVRELVKPGMTSSWVVKGAHSLTFRKWMKLDQEYMRNADFGIDIQILIKTAEIVLKQIPKQLLKR